MSEMFLKKSTQLHTQNYCFTDCKFNQMQPKADRVNLVAPAYCSWCTRQGSTGLYYLF